MSMMSISSAVFGLFDRKYNGLKKKRSSYGKGYDAITNILQYEGQFCYIPTGNAGFRKRLHFFCERGFSNVYKEYILSSDRCTNITTLAKLQPFCRKNNIDIGVYNLNSENYFLEQ